MANADVPTEPGALRGQTVALLHARGERLLDENVAAAPESLESHGGMACRRSQDVDRVQAGLGHCLERRPGGDGKACGDGARPLLDQVGDPDDPDLRHAVKGADVELTDIASADKADTKLALGFAIHITWLARYRTESKREVFQQKVVLGGVYARRRKPDASLEA